MFAGESSYKKALAGTGQRRDRWNLSWGVTFLYISLRTWSVSPLKKVKREVAAQCPRPKVSGKTVLFPRNDRPYGLKRTAFQTEIALAE